MIRRPDLPLAAAGFAAVAALLTCVGAAPEWLHLAFGVPLAVLLPGLPLALAPLPAFEHLGAVGRMTLAVGISIVTDIALGLGLAALGVPLTPAASVIALGSVAVAGNGWLALHLMRQHSHDAHPDASPVLVTGLALVALAVGVAMVSQAKALQPTYGTIVQLWALPSSEDSGAVSIGVGNQVSDRHGFRLRAEQGHASLLDDAIDVAVGETATFTVQASAETSEPVVVTLSTFSGETLRTAKVWLR